MLRYSALAAVLAFAAACSDSTTQPSTSSGNGPVIPATADRFATARGQIIPTNVDGQSADAGVLTPVLMLTDAGDSLLLIGPVARQLANTFGVEVLVQGQVDADGAMTVAAYILHPEGSCNDAFFRIIVDDPSQCGQMAAQMKARAVRR